MLASRLTDEVFERLERDSFAVVHSFLPADELAEIAAAVRELHPRGGPRSLAFPYPAHVLNASILNEECVTFAKRWCGTDDVRYRSGGTLVRYGDPEVDTGPVTSPLATVPPVEKDCHVDNFSLLPPTEDRRHKQIFFWFLLNDCDDKGNPTRFYPSRARGIEPVVLGEDVDDDGPIRPHPGLVRTGEEHLFTAPAGSLAIFTSHTLHGRNRFLDPHGERLVLTHRWGRADHRHEGQARFTMSGANPEFQRLISSLSPREREYFGFPKLGHEYYTPTNLLALERQYPGWNRSGEYAATGLGPLRPLASPLPRFADVEGGERLGAEQAQQLYDRGFAVCPSFLDPLLIAKLSEEIRRVHPPFDEMVAKHGRPGSEALQEATRHPNISVQFPYAEPTMNTSAMHPEVIAFVKRWFGTEEVAFRPGGTLVRYPTGMEDPNSNVAGVEAEAVERGDTDQHIDNFSLLPPSEDPAFGLLFFWYYLEDVPTEFGPTRFWPTKQGGSGTVKSFDQQVYTGPTAAGPAFESGLPAGSLVIFTSATIHGRNTFKVPYGQRYVRTKVLKHSWGRSDSDWEGQGPMGNIGLLSGRPEFKEMVRDISPQDRTYLHFPPIGDDYYTPATLRELEAVYPGFDASGDYAARAKTTVNLGWCQRARGSTVESIKPRL